MAVRRRNIVILIVAWVGANWLAYLAVGWHDRTSREADFNLRRGILKEFEVRELEVSGVNGKLQKIPYRLFSPTVLRSNELYPVVLYLHGAGERGNDNSQQLRSLPTVLTGSLHRQTYPCFVVVPQCPDNFDWSSFRNCFLNAESDRASDIVVQMINRTLKHRNADSRRVYIIGFSMGSSGAWDLAASYPDLFAAIVPISCGGSSTLAEHLVSVPVWAVHGDSDQICRVEDTRRLVQSIRDFGGSPRYTELPNTGHHAWGHVVGDSVDVLDWMFQQRK